MEITVKDSEPIDDGGIIYHHLIDNNGDMNFSSILIDGEDIYHNINLIQKRIQFIIDNFDKKVNKYILMIDYGEAALSKKSSVINSFPGIQQISEVFKTNKIFHKLVWRSNGLNTQIKTDFQFEPITFFLGRNIEMMFDISTRKFEHIFLSLYRGFKPIREHFHNFLRDNDILKKNFIFI